MSDKPKRRWHQFSIRWLLFTTLNIGLYLGSYRLLLSPVEVLEIGDPARVPGQYKGLVYRHREPRFLIGGVALQVVFSPLIWIDQSIHPPYWDEYLAEY